MLAEDMMGLPASVKKELEEAEKEFKETSEQQAAAAAASANPDESANSTEDVPAEPAQDQQQETPPTSTDPATQQDTPPQETVEDWKHRFEVIQGKYNAEVPRALRRIKELEDQLRDALAATTQPAPSVPAGSPNELLTKLAGEYGDDFAQMLQGVIESATSPLKTQIATLESQQGKQAVTSKEDRLTQLCADWRTINVDPTFLTWLAEYDPLSGKTRQEMLDDAGKASDMDRVAHFFNAFKATAAQPAQQQQQVVPDSNPSQQQQPAPAAPEQRVMPNNAASPTLTDQGKPFLRQADIDRFYQELTLGKFKGTQAEAEQREREIFEATREGRVIA